MMMPALPGAHLVLVHTRLTFASFEARFNAVASFDDPRQFPKSRLLELGLRYIRRCEVIPVAVPAVVLRGIRRGFPLQDTLVREQATGDNQPFLGSRSLPFEPRLHATRSEERRVGKECRSRWS